MIFYDFMLDGMKLSQFNGILYNGDGAKASLVPSMTVNVDEIVNIDGQIPYSAKFEPRVIELSIMIDDSKNKNFNRDEFVNWLSSKTPRWFNYVGDNKKIKVVSTQQIDIEIYDDRYLIAVQFIAHNPYWSLIEDNKFTQNTPSLNIVYSFNNTGSVASYPVIFLQTIGTKTDVQFSVNGITWKIRNLYTDMYIDSVTETCYSMVAGKKVNRIAEFECITEGHFKYEFPKLDIGGNNFVLKKSSLSKVVIECNSRYI